MPGDLLLFSATAPNRAQRAIVAAQRRLGYAADDARWQHAAVYIGDRYMCEAVFAGVRYHPVADMVGDRLIRVRRNRALSQAQRFHVAMRALMRLSKPYDFWSVTLSWLRSGGSAFGRAFSRNFRVRRDAEICSQLFHDAYMEATGYALVRSTAREVVPADLSACPGLVDVPGNWTRIP